VAFWITEGKILDMCDDCTSVTRY